MDEMTDGMTAEEFVDLSLPVAPRSHPWDGGAATRRLGAWADGDPARLGRVFLVGGGKNVSDRSFPIADIVDGAPHIVPRAVFAAAAVVQGARGGTRADADLLKRMLERLYARLSSALDDDTIRPPWRGRDRKERAWTPGEQSDWDGAAETFAEIAAAQGGATFEAEIFAVGTWNGETFTRADLEELARNFALLRGQVKPPLKLGHDDKQTLLGQHDGDPALGWVEALRVAGDKLIATFAGVPALVVQAIKARRYRRVSAEIWFKVRQGKELLGKVLKAVALLGADLPAVTTLKDLDAYLASYDGAGLAPEGVKTYTLTADEIGSAGARIHPADEAVAEGRPGQPGRTAGGGASDNKNHGRLTMSETRELEELRADKLRREAEERALAPLENELGELRAYKAQSEQAAAQRVSAEKAAAIKAAREKCFAVLEEAVKAGRILPAQREQAVKLFGIDDDARVVALDPEGIEAFCAALKPGATGLFSGSTEQGWSGKGDGGESAPPDVALARKARALMAEKRIDYGEAARQVLETDPALAKAYTEQTLRIAQGGDR